MKRFVQFIAGAVCPECKSLDTIAISADDNEIYCVKCEFKEKRPTDKSQKSDEKINVINLEEFRKNKG